MSDLLTREVRIAAQETMKSGDYPRGVYSANNVPNTEAVRAASESLGQTAVENCPVQNPELLTNDQKSNPPDWFTEKVEALATALRQAACTEVDISSTARDNVVRFQYNGADGFIEFDLQNSEKIPEVTSDNQE